MSDMVGAISGKHATVLAVVNYNAKDLAVDVVGWHFEPRVGYAEYATNVTEGHRKAVATYETYSGSISVLLHKNKPRPFHAGDIVTLQFHIDDTGDNYIEATVLIVGHPIPADINDGGTVEVQYDFAPFTKAIYHGLLAAMLVEASAS